MARLVTAATLAVLISAVAVCDDLKQGDTGRYRVYQAGNEIGNGFYLVAKADESEMEITGEFILSPPSGRTAIHSSLVTDSAGNPKRYHLFATQPDGSTYEKEVAFTQGKAEVTVVAGESQKEEFIDLPEDWVVLDTNSLPLLALFVSRLSPEMEPVEGQAFVPTEMRVADYALENAGEAEYELSGNKLVCRLYKINFASALFFDIYVADGQLVALSQTPGDVKLELVIE